MKYRFVNARINSSSNAYKSHKKFVKIGPAVCELKWDRMWKLCCDSAEIWRSSFIRQGGVLKRIRM